MALSVIIFNFSTELLFVRCCQRLKKEYGNMQPIFIIGSRKYMFSTFPPLKSFFHFVANFCGPVRSNPIFNIHEFDLCDLGIITVGNCELVVLKKTLCTSD